MKKLASVSIQSAPSEDFDQTARMRTLIRIFAGRTCPKVRFRIVFKFTTFPTVYVTPCQCVHASSKLKSLSETTKLILKTFQQIRKSQERLTNWWSITGMLSKSDFIALGRLKCIKICLLQVPANLKWFEEISFVTAELLLVSSNLIWNQERSRESFYFKG